MLLLTFLFSLHIHLSLAIPVALDKTGTTTFKSQTFSASTSYSKIVAFGDSFTDNGHGAWKISNHTWPLKSPYYSNHRFSNGKVWVETLSELLDVPLKDYAVGGATTNNSLIQGFTGPASTIPVPSTLDQINSYLSLVELDQNDISTTLFVVAGGGNDAFFGYPDLSGYTTVSALEAGVNLLKAKGAQHFLIPNLPPFGSHYPFSTLVPSYASFLTTFAEEVKTGLKELATSDESIKVVNTYDLFNYLQQNSKKYGFDSTKFGTSCVVGVYMEVAGGITICDDPKEYFWWDEYHPTTRVHTYLGKAAFNALNRH